MSYTNIEDLEVYNLAEDLSDDIWSLVIQWDYLDIIHRKLNGYIRFVGKSSSNDSFDK